MRSPPGAASVREWRTVPVVGACRICVRSVSDQADRNTVFAEAHTPCRGRACPVGSGDPRRGDRHALPASGPPDGTRSDSAQSHARDRLRHRDDGRGGGSRLVASLRPPRGADVSSRMVRDDDPRGREPTLRIEERIAQTRGGLSPPRRCPICAAHAATANNRRGPGTPLSSYSPRSSNTSPDPATRSTTVFETSTSPAPASAPTRAPMLTAMPVSLLSTFSHSPVCRPALISSPSDRTASRIASAQRMASCGAVERDEETVACRVDLQSLEPFELTAYGRVVRFEQRGPRTVASGGGELSSSRQCP